MLLFWVKSEQNEDRDAQASSTSCLLFQSDCVSTCHYGLGGCTLLSHSVAAYCVIQMSFDLLMFIPSGIQYYKTTEAI